jgi:RsiW-degrading membrane proteinase PrsW (M82 family)
MLIPKSIIFESMLLIALAIAPGIAISLFIYSRDKMGKEPLRYLVISFLLGMASTIPALIIQLIAGDDYKTYHTHSILAYALYSFGIVALSEEGSKFLVLRAYAYPKPDFNEPFDGVVYAVMVGMGFATVENIEYIQRFGFHTGVVRFFLSVPAHAAFAILMGYQVGMAKWTPSRSTWLMWKGLLIAVFFHGTFDFFLFLQQNRAITEYVSEGLLSFGAFATFYIAIRLALRTLRMHRESESTII